MTKLRLKIQIQFAICLLFLSLADFTYAANRVSKGIVSSCKLVMTMGAKQRSRVVDVSIDKGASVAFEFFVSVIDSINGFLPKSSLIPEDIGILVVPVSATAQFHPELGIIEVPEKYQRKIDGHSFSKGIADSGIILAHEYGHAIFQKLLNSIAQYQKTRRLVKKELNTLGNRVIYYVDKIDSLKEKIVDAKVPSRKRQLQIELEQLELEDRINGEKLNQLSDWDLDFQKIIESYDEFFADVIARAYASSPDLFIEAFFFEQDQGNTRKEAQARDFRRNSRVSKWMSTYAHTFFAPVRGDFEKKMYLAGSEPDLKSIVSIATEAIRFEIEALAAFPGKELPTHRELNLRLKGAFENLMTGNHHF